MRTQNHKINFNRSRRKKRIVKEIKPIAKVKSIFEIHQKEAKKLVKNYPQYLKTTYWKLIRRRKLLEKRYTCELCIERKESILIHIHHTTYKIVGNEHNNLSKLMVVCSNCHYKIHDKNNNLYKQYDPYRNNNKSVKKCNKPRFKKKKSSSKHLSKKTYQPQSIEQCINRIFSI